MGLEDDVTLSGDAWIALRLAIDGVSIRSDDLAYNVELSDEPTAGPFSTVTARNATVAVVQGQHTVAIQAMEIGFGTYIHASSVSAVFAAFGGGIPAIPVGEPNTIQNN